MAPTYTIRSISDFLQVPEDRRDACLREFAVFLSILDYSLVLMGSDLRPALSAAASFVWCDDGVEACTGIHFTVKDDETGEAERIASITADGIHIHGED